MTALLLLASLSAAEIPLLLPRSTEGVAAGIGQLRAILQACVSDSPGPDSSLVHLRFTVDASGKVGTVESALTDGNPALTTCMAAPFQSLQFDPGEQEMPVEVPISVQRTHTEQTKTRQ